MNHKREIFSIFTLMILLIASGSASAQDPGSTAQTPVGTAFTYQGRLSQGGTPANGIFDFEFCLFDTLNGGNQVGVPIPFNDLSLTDGYFTIQLNFGESIFNGQARYLEVSVRLGTNTGGFTILSPRQELTATPNALYSLSAPWSGLTGIPTGFADGIDNDTTSFWSLTGNSGTDPAINFIGTADNVGLTFVVSGTTALRLEPGTVPNLIGGLFRNSVTPGVVGGTISGGGSTDLPNQVQANYGTVGGGIGNTASGAYATVGGGKSNTASGVYNPTIAGGWENIASGDYAATVGGGYLNTASGSSATVGGGYLNNASGTNSIIAGGIGNNATGDTATVGGGASNTANGFIATVGGGQGNTASGANATIAGGANNIAAGDFSFAAGWFARANNRGCFVWGDATELYEFVNCDVDNRWVARASGGVYFYANSTLTSGMYLAAGGSSWNAVSNPALKDHFATIDNKALVQNLASIPITTWNYKAQDASIRHIGPMADDFNTLLPGLGGEGEMSINSLDADGIALASIQGLYQIIQEKDNHINELEARVAALEAIQGTDTSTDIHNRYNLNTWLPGLIGLLGVAAGVFISRKRGGIL